MNQKGFANIVLIAIVLAAILGIGGYFILTRKPTQVVQQTTSIPTPSVTQVPSTSKQTSTSVTKDPMANWKTSSLAGIQFKYPTDWKVLSSGTHMGAAQIILSQPNGERETMIVSSITPSEPEYTSQYVKEWIKLAVPNSVQTFKTEVTSYNEEKIYIDGNEGIKASGLAKDKYLSSEGNLKVTKVIGIFFLKNRTLYVMRYVDIDGNFEKEFNLIVQTIRFL